MVLAGGGEKCMLAKPRTEWRGVNYDCGCNSGFSLRDTIGSKNRTPQPLEQYT